MDRKSTLNSAIEYVCGTRENEYGSPKDNFTAIGSFWSSYLHNKKAVDVPIDAEDVALMMALFKIGRLTTGAAKSDTYIDAAGYIACAAEIGTETNI